MGEGKRYACIAPMKKCECLDEDGNCRRPNGPRYLCKLFAPGQEPTSIDLKEDLADEIMRKFTDMVPGLPLEDRKKLLGQIIHLIGLMQHDRNVALDALGMVWCNGGCKSGVFRFTDDKVVTEEMVRQVEKNARRLREWFENRQFRQSHQKDK